jgi:hypothetical protein
MPLVGCGRDRQKKDNESGADKTHGFTDPIAQGVYVVSRLRSQPAGSFMFAGGTLPT